MSTYSRNYILSRRGGGVADLSAMTLTSGELDIDQAELAGVYSVNCSHQVGIATSTEVGLAPTRYPIRVILASNVTNVPGEANETVCSYWRVTNAANVAIPFSRKPLNNDIAIKNLYHLIPGLDDILWSTYRQVSLGVSTNTHDQEIDALNEALYNILQLPNPTSEQTVAVSEAVADIIKLCKASFKVPVFKVGDNVYIRAEPHGMAYEGLGNSSASKAAIVEAALCMTINHGRLKKAYDSVPEGVVTIGAYSIAAMFRHGLFESFEHKEYYTAIMTPSPTNATQYIVSAVRSPSGLAVPAEIAPNTVVDLKDLKIMKQMVELSNLMVMTSGLMHYLFNHTTGGTVMTGTMLSVLCMYKLISADMPHELHSIITSVMYEALHPTNKRAIANIIFQNTGVTTHGRCTTARRYDQFSLDAFVQIRKNPYPAGSHKAFICLQALRRVLQSGLGPFLPWADQMGSCIQLCADVLKHGARSHIGASYYTGDPPIAQPSSIDQYLPELAQYVHTFNRGDSLSFSPHLAEDIGRKASMNWQNLLRDLKGKDVSATSADTVRKFLATSGVVHFTFDPENQETWGQAVTDARLARQAIDGVFR